MQDTIITWNLENWVTIVLMAGIGFAVVGLATSMARKGRGQAPQYGGGQSAQ